MPGKQGETRALPPRILIVTPTRNSEEYLDETLDSVLSQSAGLEIYYHIQDSCSTDATLDIVRRRSERIDAGVRAGAEPSVHLSWSSEPDRSMYDGINKGFHHLLEKLGEGSDDRVTVMTWLNSDDRLAYASLRTVAAFMTALPHVEWLTGVPSFLFGDGTLGDMAELSVYYREYLREGRYDGRRLRFLQQEGTFWSLRLWRLVGGLDASLRLAGDWDLWRRFAEHTDIVTLRTVLGQHRRHAGQLSENMLAYWKEVDAIIERSTVGAEDVTEPFGYVGGRNGVTKEWTTDRWSNVGWIRETRFEGDGGGAKSWVVTFASKQLHHLITATTGLSFAEQSGRWSDAALSPSVRIQWCQMLPLRFTLTIGMRVVDARRCSPVVVTIGDTSFSVDVSTELQEYTLEVKLKRPAGTIDIAPAGTVAPPGDVRLLAIQLTTMRIDVHDDPVPDAESSGAASDGSTSPKRLETDRDGGGGHGWRVDFTSKSLQPHIEHHTGLAHPEEWGRWSDAHVAPTVRLESSQPLPLRFKLTLRMRMMETLPARQVTLRVGSQSFVFEASTTFQDHAFDVMLPRPTRIIDLAPSSTADPPGDPRRISMALVSMRVEPLENAV